MSSIIDQLLQEAELELAGLEKEANDANGAPDNVSNQEKGGGDILTTAQALLQKVEQFKATLGQNAASQGTETDPNAQANAVQDPNAQAQVVGAAPTGNSEVVITRPDGTTVKLASLQKLASLRGSNLFKEV